MAPGIPGFAKEVVWTVDWHGDIGTCSSCWRNFYSRMAFLRQPNPLGRGVFNETPSRMWEINQKSHKNKYTFLLEKIINNNSLNKTTPSSCSSTKYIRTFAKIKLLTSYRLLLLQLLKLITDPSEKLRASHFPNDKITCIHFVNHIYGTEKIGLELV